jgi:hypothetical protein
VDNHAHAAASILPVQVKETLVKHLVENPKERFSGRTLQDICLDAGIASPGDVTTEIFGFSAVS